MSNSFYYFFSATPQVIGGILALFGVFVIFKIQTIKTELLSIGLVIVNHLQILVGSGPLRKDDNTRKKIGKLIHEIDQCLIDKDINNLKSKMDNSEFVKENNSTQSDINMNKYYQKYTFLQNLIRDTVNSSIFAAVVIVVCLAILPFGDFLICHRIILYFTFGIVIISIAYCFFNLISILRRSIIETADSL